MTQHEINNETEIKKRFLREIGSMVPVRCHSVTQFETEFFYMSKQNIDGSLDLNPFLVVSCPICGKTEMYNAKKYGAEDVHLETRDFTEMQQGDTLISIPAMPHPPIPVSQSEISAMESAK